MAYALYLRKSRADEELGHENTLARHEEMLRDLADRNNIYVDEAHIYREIVSGESIEARPQMQRLLKAVEAGMYTGVLCIELERLSRGNGADQAKRSIKNPATGTPTIKPKDHATSVTANAVPR